MLIAALLCLVIAAVSAAIGVTALARPHTAVDRSRQVLRSLAPTQLAAAAILVAGGVVALTASRNVGLPVLIVCILGAFATIAAGSVQGARYVAAVEAQTQAQSGGCAQACASCTLSCSR
ncbi:MAG: hypothetical protein ACSLE6_18765 [Mycobacterium sp.]